MEIHLIGAATAAGYSFRRLCDSSLAFDGVFAYSRSALADSRDSGLSEYCFLDLDSSVSFVSSGSSKSPKIWVSFAPIWKLAPYLEHLATHHPNRLQGLFGIVACSSSSVITKRFAVNCFDRELVNRLTSEEHRLLAICRRLDVPCRILLPTLIYGQAGPYGDSNLSRLLALLRRLPLVPLPDHTGLRQPIHARQLAAVALHLSEQLAGSGWNSSLPERISVGGDTTLTYSEMISALQQAQPPGDPARRCRFLSIPNRMFYFLAAPLLLRSPKAFEAVLRMGANLSGFTPAHQILGSEPQPFPVMPLA